MMHDRSGLLGGGGRTLNLVAAVKIGGFKDPDIIYRAIESGQIEINRKLIAAGGVRDPNSWILIERDSFLQWLEDRSHLSLEVVEEKYAALRQDHQSAILRIGHLQHEISGLHGEIKALKLLLVENLRSRKVGETIQKNTARER
jgi:hypothetical protein